MVKGDKKNKREYERKKATEDESKNQKKLEDFQKKRDKDRIVAKQGFFYCLLNLTEIYYIHISQIPKTYSH